MPSAVPRAALLVLLLAPAAARATAGRLSLALGAQGGYTSAALGGGGGEAGFAAVDPSVRLDLALAPAWKLAVTGEGGLIQYLSTGEPVVTGAGGVQLRFLGGDRLELSLAAGGDGANLGAGGGPLDPSLVSSPMVRATQAGDASALLRLWGGGLEWRLGASGERRSSRALSDRARVGSFDVAGLAGISWPFARRAALALAARLAHTTADRPEFAVTSAALHAQLTFGLGPLDARLLGQGQRSRFGTGARERVGRLTAALALPVGAGIAVEAAYTLSGNATRPDRTLGTTRQQATLGLRWRAPEVRW